MNAAKPIRETDVLVIGAGLAGCAAAYAAARQGLRVTILTREKEFTESSSYYAQGGIIYEALDDTLEAFLQDFQKTGAGISYHKAVETVFENRRLVREILIDDVAVPFTRDAKGKLDRIREAAHSKPRIIHVKDTTGKSIQERFYQKLRTVENIEIVTQATCVDLITLAHHSLNPLHIYEPSTCAGAYVFFQSENKVYPILAKYTILATGGLGRLYLHTSNPKTARGEGYAMAYRAGARLMNMEYVQFHPTTLFSNKTDERFLITEAMRGEGAVLRNESGEAFMERYHPDKELAPRDIVARSIMQEISDTNSHYVYLDITHRNSDWIRERFPAIHAKCLQYKVDITAEGIPVVPAAHYECGGVASDMLANTTIRRLKAVGEVACTGLHGANRLASSSLLECLIFGFLAGRDCYQRITKEEFITPRVGPWLAEDEEVDADVLRQDWLTIRHTMWNYVGIIRNKKKIARAHGILGRLKDEIEPFYRHGRLSDKLLGLRNAATTSLLVLHAVELHKGSLGCHHRVN